MATLPIWELGFLGKYILSVIKIDLTRLQFSCGVYAARNTLGRWIEEQFQKRGIKGYTYTYLRSLSTQLNYTFAEIDVRIVGKFQLISFKCMRLVVW